MSKKIIIDGKEYDVAIVAMKRRADILDKSANRSEDGVLHREVIGTFYNYELRLYCRPQDMDTYNELWWVLSAPVASHVVELPHDHYSFDGYFSSIEDLVQRITDDGAIYKGLSCKLTAMRPRRTANG